MVEEVTHDARISGGAVRLFNELTLWAARGDGTVSRGQRALAKAIHVTKDTVQVYIAELEAAGHISVGRNGNHRHWYALTNAEYREGRTSTKKRKVA